MAEQEAWFLRVVADTGKKYSLKVKGTDTSEVTAEMLKPKLAESSGVPVAKQVLSFKGQELNGNVTFSALGIKPDDELRLSVTNDEVQYYTDVISDAMSGFDKTVAEAGGETEFMMLPNTPRNNGLKDLGRKVRSMNKHIESLKGEVEWIRAEPRRAEILQVIEKETARMHKRSAILSYLSGEAREGTPTGVAKSPAVQQTECDPLLKPAPPLSEAMEAFYSRVHAIYLGIEAVKRRTENTHVTGRLTRLGIDLKILWADLLVTDKGSLVENAIMQSVATDCRSFYVKVLRQFLDGDNGKRREINKDEWMAALNDPFLHESQLPRDEVAMIKVVQGAKAGVVEAEATMAVLNAVSGLLPPVSQYAPLQPPNGHPLVTPIVAPPADGIGTPSTLAAPTSASPPDALAQAPVLTQAPPPHQPTEGFDPTTPIDKADEYIVVEPLAKGDLWRARLNLFYLHYKRSNLSRVDKILDEYKGQEDKLFTELFDKYKLVPEYKDALHTELLTLAKANNIQPAAAPPPPENQDGSCSVM